MLIAALSIISPSVSSIHWSGGWTSTVHWTQRS